MHSFNNAISYPQISTWSTLLQLIFLFTSISISLSWTFLKYQLEDPQSKMLSTLVLWHQGKGWRRVHQKSLTLFSLRKTLSLWVTSWSGGQAKVCPLQVSSCTTTISFSRSLYHTGLVSWSVVGFQKYKVLGTPTKIIQGQQVFYFPVGWPVEFMRNLLNLAVFLRG